MKITVHVVHGEWWALLASFSNQRSRHRQIGGSFFFCKLSNLFRPPAIVPERDVCVSQSVESERVVVQLQIELIKCRVHANALTMYARSKTFKTLTDQFSNVERVVCIFKAVFAFANAVILSSEKMNVQKECIMKYSIYLFKFHTKSRSIFYVFLCRDQQCGWRAIIAIKVNISNDLSTNAYLIACEFAYD